MIIEELAYKVTVRAEEFLSGKKKVEQGAKDLGDNVTESFGEVGKATKEAGKGVKAVGDQTKKTADDTKRPFGLISGGFNLAAKKAKEFGKEGKDAFSTVGLGAAKFLGLALSIEGTRRLFTSAVNNAVDLKNVSSFLDMDPKAVDGWKKGAESVGSSAEAITGALLKMKNASAQMNGYGGPVDSSTEALLRLNGETHQKFDIFGTQDPGEMLKRAEAAYRTLDKNKQLFYLNNVGIDASLDPSIRDGRLDKAQDSFQRSSGYTDKMGEEAEKVKFKMTQLSQAVDGVGFSLVRAFGDDAIQIMQTFNQWVSANGGQVINFFKDATGWAKQFTDALSGNKNAMHGWGQITDNFNIFTGFKKPVFDLKTLLNGNYDTQMQNSLNHVHDIMSGKGPLPPSSFAPLAGKDGFTEPAGTSLWDRITGLFSEEPTQHAQSARRNRAMGEIMNAVMMTESRGNPNAVSPAGAVGAYQFMPDTARDMGLRVDESVDERRDPAKSRAAATKYMNQLLNRYGGNIELALMAYNGGMGRVDDALKGKGKPLAQETLDYPGKVADYYQQVSQLAGMQGMAGMQTQSVDNSQTTSNHYGTIQLNTNPQSIDEIAKSIDEQRRRSTMTGAFISGNG